MIKCVIMNVAALIRHITTKKIYIVRRKFYVPIYSRLAEGSVGFIVLDTGYAKYLYLGYYRVHFLSCLLKMITFIKNDHTY